MTPASDEGAAPQGAAPASQGTKVTALDVATGENDSVALLNDYVCVTDGTCHIAHVQSYGNGTHILTIKGRSGS